MKTREKAKINGKDFPYALCDFKDKGEPKEGIVGLFTDPASGKAVLVMGFNAPGKYDNKVTLTLLGGAPQEPEKE
ncbi:MAG: hypothetical protein RDV48_22020 [Candidatus Eremiobacteraeota bacterium]|nr:hypothetical protein [Candidatus Eremiobacteraeota bacterium]